MLSGGGFPEGVCKPHRPDIHNGLIVLVLQELISPLEEHQKNILIAHCGVIGYFFCALPDYPKHFLHAGPL